MLLKLELESESLRKLVKHRLPGPMFQSVEVSKSREELGNLDFYQVPKSSYCCLSGFYFEKQHIV